MEFDRSDISFELTKMFEITVFQNILNGILKMLVISVYRMLIKCP